MTTDQPATPRPRAGTPARLPALDNFFGLDQLLADYWQAAANVAVRATAMQVAVSGSVPSLWSEYWAGWLSTERVGESEPANIGQRHEHAVARVNTAMTRLLHTPRLLALQGQLSTASARLQASQRALVDAMQPWLPLATSTELQDVGHDVVELRRQVRRLTRQLEGLQTRDGNHHTVAAPPPGHEHRSGRKRRDPAARTQVAL